jgi:hypothetical protein
MKERGRIIAFSVSRGRNHIETGLTTHFVRLTIGYQDFSQHWILIELLLLKAQIVSAPAGSKAIEYYHLYLTIRNH